ncbi:hypothetical protein [Candidatus Arsenophonus triatominarum]|uniref:hypothetical protein n=1 Tax=Candidatus Arsenophonus triatominarum TaxID=57911 RepID=UPI0007C5BBF6|nr:hypothetical protein [Candidatus Arsenophonus triatominarum]
MATEIRLEGALFNRVINDYDISKIQSATNRSDVESLWGKIIDWFCGTRKEEAKKALFDIIHNDDNKGNYYIHEIKVSYRGIEQSN